jgi:hypothetical protein
MSMSISLPSPERRATLRSFTIVTMALLAALAWLLASWADRPEIGPAGATAAAVLAVVMWRHPMLARRPYRFWNRSVVRPLHRVAEEAVLAICFVTVVVVAARQGQPAAEEQRVTRWRARRSLAPDEYALPYAVKRPARAGEGWVRAYGRWAFESDNAWSALLLPFLAVLSFTADENRQAVHANIYTLF